MWYTGIDWANAHHDALVLDEQGRRVGSLRVDHSAKGLAPLNTFLEQISSLHPKEEMACIIETTHGLLIAFLLEHGWPVYPVNPRTVDRRRSASGAKTDAIDAYLLAKTGRADFADLRRLTPDSEKIAELKALTRDQDSLIVMQTRLVNQLTACLKTYYPVALELFGKLQQKSTLLFLQAYPTPQAAQAASRQQIQHLPMSGPGSSLRCGSTSMVTKPLSLSEHNSSMHAARLRALSSLKHRITCSSEVFPLTGWSLFI